MATGRDRKCAEGQCNADGDVEKIEKQDCEERRLGHAGDGCFDTTGCVKEREREHYSGGYGDEDLVVRGCEPCGEIFG